MQLRSSVGRAAIVFALVGASAAVARAAFTPTDDPVNLHLAAAQKATGLDFPGLLARVCIVPPTGNDAAAGRRRAAGGVNGLLPADPTPRKEVVPPRSEWYQEPRQIFDNFYWVGNLRNNAWVLKTSGGLIVIDTLFHYSVQASIVDGITKLGMNPRDIKYVLMAVAIVCGLLGIAASVAVYAKKKAKPRAKVKRRDPIFIDRAVGTHVFDVDGNGYVDYLASWGPAILGHAAPVVIDALRDALARGTSYGAPTEREVVFEEYSGKEGDIISGVVHRLEARHVFIDLGKTDALLPRSEIIPGETFKPGDRVQAYLFVYTAQRSNEIRCLRWEDVDFRAREITFLVGKNGKKIAQPLPMVEHFRGEAKAAFDKERKFAGSVVDGGLLAGYNPMFNSIEGNNP